MLMVAVQHLARLCRPQATQAVLSSRGRAVLVIVGALVDNKQASFFSLPSFNRARAHVCSASKEFGLLGKARFTLADYDDDDDD